MMRLVPIMFVWVSISASAPAMEHVVLRRDGREITVIGRVVVETQDGGVMLQSRDGMLWRVPPEEQITRASDDEPFAYLDRDALSRQLLDELPPGFDVFSTSHYLICHSTSRAYAQWCGALFERLYMAFTNFWSRKGLPIVEPEFPLVAIVFSDRASYIKHAEDELGEAAGSIIGYYSLDTNRMTMYDLSGLSLAREAGGRRGTIAEINHILSRPEAAMTTATIVHEATHQIAYSCGLQVRHSDSPIWYAEGIAVYFETPDLRSSRGWRNVGALNRPRLAQFHDYLTRRPPDSLLTLLTKDDRFRQPDQALDAYAETWALTYFLIRQRGEQYFEYARRLSQKEPLEWDDPQTRIDEFQEVFGDLAELDRELLRYFQRIR